MGRIDIRNLPDDVVQKLTLKAEKKKMSREAYVRELLTLAASKELLQETEMRYQTLVNQLVDLIQEQGEIIERNSLLMEILMEEKS